MDDIDVVTASLERVRLRAGHVVRYFYAHLFTHHPRAPPFPAAMDDQYERLFAALVQVVEHLGHPALPAHLHRLGRDHRKFGISDEDSPPWARASSPPSATTARAPGTTGPRGMAAGATDSSPRP